MCDPNTSTKKPVVLVVEEEDGVRQLLNLALGKYGFTVFQAAGGKEAVDLYRQHAAVIDLVLMDVRMRELDGQQTFTLLKKMNPELRCCFMTGDTASARTDELVAMGALRVFRKPFTSLANLAHILEELVNT